MPKPEPSTQNNNQNSLPTFGMIMPITGGSSLEFENKRQRRNYFREVNVIIPDGPPMKPEWAHMPISFTGEDFKLKTTSHNDAMVIKALIAGWSFGKVLVDTGSSADILFANSFREMNTLDPADIPLLSFGGKPVKALGKIALPV
ncbi:uncharacterized protein [Setaria viridis]|uniref:uncharacterized protein n=1 Tax=Setaria viridis TaxID=4556 RepID=UPI003B3A1228